MALQPAPAAVRSRAGVPSRPRGNGLPAARLPSSRTTWTPTLGDRGLADVGAEGAPASCGLGRPQSSGPAAEVAGRAPHRAGTSRPTPSASAHQRSASSGNSRPSARRRKRGPRPVRTASEQASAHGRAEPGAVKQGGAIPCAVLIGR
ncbi:hypothetical protein [Streptomyces sp. NPDC058964]|uniref:hypothetical protein n=1 Tax=Streptomyces sp. NPDC058964 TaxID=3346681 RepID=UPI0036B041BF